LIETKKSGISYPLAFNRTIHNPSSTDRLSSTLRSSSTGKSAHPSRTLLVLYSLPLNHPSSSGGMPAIGSIKTIHLHAYPITLLPLRYPSPTGCPPPPTMGPAVRLLAALSSTRHLHTRLSYLPLLPSANRDGWIPPEKIYLHYLLPNPQGNYIHTIFFYFSWNSYPVLLGL
jgi:hypothetical protein